MQQLIKDLLLYARVQNQGNTLTPVDLEASSISNEGEGVIPAISRHERLQKDSLAPLDLLYTTHWSIALHPIGAIIQPEQSPVMLQYARLYNDQFLTWVEAKALPAVHEYVVPLSYRTVQNLTSLSCSQSRIHIVL